MPLAGAAPPIDRSKLDGRRGGLRINGRALVGLAFHHGCTGRRQRDGSRIHQPAQCRKPHRREHESHPARGLHHLRERLGRRHDPDVFGRWPPHLRLQPRGGAGDSNRHPGRRTGCVCDLSQPAVWIDPHRSAFVGQPGGNRAAGHRHADVPGIGRVGTSAPLSLAIGSTPPGDYPFTAVGAVPGGGRSAPGDLKIAYNICVLYDQTQVKKAGSTIPIKLQLCDANGANVSSPNVVVHAVYLQFVSGSVPPVIPDDSGNANPDSDFRFDATIGTTGGYIFNLSTNGLTAGAWSLVFTAGADPTFHPVGFLLK